MPCNSTYLLDPTTDHDVKADELGALLAEILEDADTKVVIFSQWLRTHEVILRRIEQRRWPCVLFHGRVPGAKRKDLIARFREDPACRLFLSTDAGGIGLNLQFASVVIIMDQPWNPAVLEQRIGRVHRLGQRRPVRVNHFIAQGTIEEGMLSLLTFKRGMFAGVLDGGTNEVFLGGSRLKRFMESVEKATQCIPERMPPAEAEPPEGLAPAGQAQPDQPAAPPGPAAQPGRAARRGGHAAQSAQPGLAGARAARGRTEAPGAAFGARRPRRAHGAVLPQAAAAGPDLHREGRGVPVGAGADGAAAVGALVGGGACLDGPAGPAYHGGGTGSTGEQVMLRRCRRRRGRMGASARAAIACVLGVAAFGASASAEGLHGAVELLLEGALWDVPAGDRTGSYDLRVFTDCIRGKWAGRFIAWSMEFDEAGRHVRSYSKAVHHGRLRAEAAEGKLRLSLDLQAQEDLWAPVWGPPGGLAGRGTYDVELSRSGEGLSGTFTGTFTGTFQPGTLQAKAVKGKVRGVVYPYPALDGRAPAGRGEHPRLFFRREDVAALRDKADTPVGRAILARLARSLQREAPGKLRAFYAAGHALRYVLTGERRHAETAGQIVRQAVGAELGDLHWGSAAPAVLGAAMAYDLCHDAWDPDFRAAVARVLYDKSSRMIHQIDYRYRPWQAGYALSCGAAGVAMLATLGDPLASAAAGDGPEVLDLPPPGGVSVGEGVPTTTFASDKCPENWVTAGPFAPLKGSAFGPLAEGEGRDFLASIGGAAGARPAAGTEVRVRGLVRRFRVLTREFVCVSRYAGEKLVVDVLNSQRRVVHSTAYFYTVLINDRTRLVQVRLDVRGPDPTCRMWLAGRSVRHGQTLRLRPGRYPWLIEADTGAAAPWSSTYARPRLAEQTAEQVEAARAARLAEWRRHQEGAARDDIGGGVPHRLRLADAGVRRYLRYAVGEHGWGEEAEEDVNLAFQMGVFPFLQARRCVTGLDMAPGSPAGWVLPLWVMRSVVGRGEMDYPAYGDAGTRRVPHASVFPAGLSLVRADLRPAVLWMYDRLWGADGDGSFGGELPLHFVQAFVNYPLGVKAAGPAGALPLALIDRRKGFCVFRNRFKDADDIVACVNLRSQQMDYHRPEGGGFRILGLGERWAVHPRASASGGDNVVGAGGASANGARLLDYQARPDGSGTVNMGIYRPGRDWERMSPEALAIKVRRTFAADYGGAAGCDALFVVIDTFDGEERWQMNTAAGNRVAVEGSRFTITGRSGASLAGTFLAPAAVQVGRGAVANTVLARGADRFVVVMTLQRGAAPAVAADGPDEAGAIRIRVGGRTVRFDPRAPSRIVWGR